jgi:predicted membrane protein
MDSIADRLMQSFVTHADIGHLALLIWALCASALVAYGVKEASQTARRTETFMQDFLHELSRFNRRHEDDAT